MARKRMIVIGAVAAVAVVSAIVYRRRAGQVTVTTTQVVKPKISKDLKIPFTTQTTIQEKVLFLDQNDIPVSLIPDLKDKALSDFITQNFIGVSPEIKEKIMSLDIPDGEKLEILEEFDNIFREVVIYFVF